MGGDNGTALGIIIGSAITALGGAIALVWKSWSDAKAKTAEIEIAKAKADAEIKAKVKRDAIDEWREFVEKLIAHSERKDAAIKEMKEALEVTLEREIECREDHAEQKNINFFLCDHLKRFHSALEASGADPGPFPEMPPPRKREPKIGPSPEFVVKQAIQSAELVGEVSKVIRPPQGPPSTGIHP